MPDSLPRGNVTLLFTDIEGSTRLIEELGESAYVDALSEHRRLLRAAFAAHRGVEVDTQGDAFLYAFADPVKALAAAAQGQEALASGEVKVRMGLHTGELHQTGEGYAGRELHRAARIAASGHGGQIVVSAATRALVDGDLTELGEHRLKDFDEPVALFQWGSECFPPLKTISNTNLPRPASSFVGRAREREELIGLLRNGARLVTLSGPGGSGKTRLAIEAASEIVPTFKAGVFWIELAALRDPALVSETIAQTFGAKDSLADHIGERELLLLLDNFEQVLDAAPEVSELLERCPNLKLLVTSRELLRIRGEVEYPVLPLVEPEAVELFYARSQLDRDEMIPELCRRLDDLPLAIELAAARTRVLSPAQILERLSDRLDLFEGGRDADARQRTLRATIAWSHDLLDEQEQALFARLAVFRGGCTLEAAEEVAGADIATLQSLVDKSLLRYGGERFWMLDTIHEYAADRLDEADEAAEYALRHGRHYLARLEEIYPVLRGPRDGEFLAWYVSEEDNVRAMLDRLTQVAPAEVAGHATVVVLVFFWRARGGLDEGRTLLQALLQRELSAGSRADVLIGLAHIEEHGGHVAAAETAAAEARELAEAIGDSRLLGAALKLGAVIAHRRGNAEEAVRLGRLALEGAPPGDDRARGGALNDLALGLIAAGRDDEARTMLVEAIEVFRGTGDLLGEASTRANLAELDLYTGNFEGARAGSRRVLTTVRDEGHRTLVTFALLVLAQSMLGLDRRAEARAALREALDLAATASNEALIYRSLGNIALAADITDLRRAPRLRGATATLRSRAGLELETRDEKMERRFEQPLMESLGKKIWEREYADGSTMSLNESIELARSLCEPTQD